MTRVACRDTQEQYALLQQNILMILLIISPHSTMGYPPTPSKWPSTRQLADIMGISIYKTRNLLLKLEKQGLVTLAPPDVSKSLLWYPTPLGFSI